MFRQESFQPSRVEQTEKPPWAPGGPSGGRLGRQEARPKAVWGARNPYQGIKVSWPAGGPRCPSKGRLGRQDARSEAALSASRAVKKPSWSRGRLGRQEAQNTGFSAVLLQNSTNAVWCVLQQNDTNAITDY